MSTDERSMADDVKYSFGNVAKIYEETSFLLKDFSDEMMRLGFVRLRSDSGIGTETSRSIDRPKEWHVRYASLSFKPEGQDRNEPYVCITAIFCGYESEPITPYLVAGFVNVVWQYYNFYNAYLDAKETFDGNDGKPIRLSRGDGYVYAIAQPLLNVSNTEDVKRLAQDAVKCWEEEAGNADPQAL